MDFFLIRIIIIWIPNYWWDSYFGEDEIVGEKRPPF